jgi:hypothetical protein
MRHTNLPSSESSRSSSHSAASSPSKALTAAARADGPEDGAALPLRLPEDGTHGSPIRQPLVIAQVPAVRQLDVPADRSSCVPASRSRSFKNIPIPGESSSSLSTALLACSAFPCRRRRSSRCRAGNNQCCRNDTVRKRLRFGHTGQQIEQGNGGDKW